MSKPTDFSHRRLLVVDDNRAIHGDFRKVLAGEHPATASLDELGAALFGEEPAAPALSCFEIDSAFQGQEAVTMVRQARDTNRPYALAFIDVRMPPGWDGVETTARTWEVDPDLQVVICTAYSDCSWDEMLAKLGRSDRMVILKKPFDNIEVLQLANALTEKWRLLQQSKTRLADLEALIAARTAQAAQAQVRYQTLFDESPDGIFLTTLEGRFLEVNPALAGLFHYATPAELIAGVTDVAGQFYVSPERRAEFIGGIERDGVLRNFESEVRCKDGVKKWISETATAVRDPHGRLMYYHGFVMDITARKRAEEERVRMEIQLRQAQKLESIGQLAAGIAHEINTPTQYVGDNIRFLADAFRDLGEVLVCYDQLRGDARAHPALGERADAVEVITKKVDLAYLREEIPKAIEQSLEGVNRVAKIVRAMKEFSHPGAKERTAIDLNHAIDSTITVARNEWKFVAEVVTDYEPRLPLVPVLPGEFNQVILNLVINATHAIADVVGDSGQGKGTITVTTRLQDDWIEVRVADTGTGIPETVRDRIFEPFFTTKEVGKGTGQGLAIARSVIVEKHGGQLTFETESGKGTTFIIRLPVNPATSPNQGADTVRNS